MKTIVTEIPDYRTFLRGEKTLEIGYPWLTFGAIMALEKILEDSKGQFHILEMGCGGSTIFFQNKCRTLLSIENNKMWAKRVDKKLGDSVKNVELVYDKRISKLLMYSIDVLYDESMDLVLVDGGANWKERQQLLDASHSKVKKGGWLIIDNYAHMTFDYHGYDVYTFDMFRYSGRGTKLCKKI